MPAGSGACRPHREGFSGRPPAGLVRRVHARIDRLRDTRCLSDHTESSYRGRAVLIQASALPEAVLLCLPRPARTGSNSVWSQQQQPSTCCCFFFGRIMWLGDADVRASRAAFPTGIGWLLLEGSMTLNHGSRESTCVSNPARKARRAYCLQAQKSRMVEKEERSRKAW